MNSWLVKTEPSAYSFQQLCKERQTVWDGVRNALALKHMARMQRGDRVMVYHTGSERAVVGTATVVKAPYPDPQHAAGKLLVVELAADATLNRPVALAELKATPAFDQSELVRLPRLSVMPLTAGQWKVIEATAKRPPAVA